MSKRMLSEDREFVALQLETKTKNLVRAHAKSHGTTVAATIRGLVRREFLGEEMGRGGCQHNHPISHNHDHPISRGSHAHPVSLESQLMSLFTKSDSDLLRAMKIALSES